MYGLHILYSREWINRVRLPILLVVSSRLRMWSRETGSAVPSRVSLLISIPGCVWCLLTGSSRFPRRRPSIYYERSESLIVGNEKNSTQKNVRRPSYTVQLLANQLLEDYCTYSPFFSLAIASSVHATAVGSA